MICNRVAIGDYILGTNKNGAWSAAVPGGVTASALCRRSIRAPTFAVDRQTAGGIEWVSGNHKGMRVGGMVRVLMRLFRRTTPQAAGDESPSSASGGSTQIYGILARSGHEGQSACRTSAHRSPTPNARRGFAYDDVTRLC